MFGLRGVRASALLVRAPAGEGAGLRPYPEPRVHELAAVRGIGVQAGVVVRLLAALFLHVLDLAPEFAALHRRFDDVMCLNWH